MYLRVGEYKFVYNFTIEKVWSQLRCWQSLWTSFGVKGCVHYIANNPKLGLLSSPTLSNFPEVNFGAPRFF